MDIELLELYYRKYAGIVKAADYVVWAQHHLYMDVLEIKKLASLDTKSNLNIFEMEAMFADALKALQREAPSMEECLDFHLKQLHSQLLLPIDHAMDIVKEIYDCTITYNLSEEQMNWQSISDVIDDFQYGDNLHGYTQDKLIQFIVDHARKLWHPKLSKINMKAIIGKRITDIHTDENVVIQLNEGAIIIECPWRIRDSSTILIGETDIQTNQREWKTVKELLIGKRIEDLQIFEQCPLLIIQCGHVFLDVFHASSYFDGWTLTDNGDFYLFSMHGGAIV